MWLAKLGAANHSTGEAGIYSPTTTLATDVSDTNFATTIARSTQQHLQSHSRTNIQPQSCRPQWTRYVAPTVSINEQLLTASQIKDVEAEVRPTHPLGIIKMLLTQNDRWPRLKRTRRHPTIWDN